MELTLNVQCDLNAKQVVTDPLNQHWLLGAALVTAHGEHFKNKCTLIGHAEAEAIEGIFELCSERIILSGSAVAAYLLAVDKAMDQHTLVELTCLKKADG